MLLVAIPFLFGCWEWHLCRKARRRMELLDQQIKAEEERLNRLIGYTQIIINQQKGQIKKTSK